MTKVEGSTMHIGHIHLLTMVHMLFYIATVCMVVTPCMHMVQVCTLHTCTVMFVESYFLDFPGTCNNVLKHL